MELTQVWHFDTVDARQFLIGVIGSGTYCGIRPAIDYKESFYGMEITGKKGTDRNLLSQISEDDKVFFVNVVKRREGSWDTYEGEYELLESFEVTDRSGEILFNSGDIRFFSEKVYVI
ncbi:MAG: hypothetical protein PHW52_01645 [Candidatus Pacebacteria bacterium]|nr:hypothetical protein [Candidatus Paceibacterota bacterium]